VLLCAGLVVVPGASGARFSLTLHARDTLAWNAPKALECARTGSGTQTVDIRTTHPFTTQLSRGGSPGVKGELLLFGGRYGGALFPATGTVTRVDDTTGGFLHEGCQPLPPKDCGTRPLTAFHPYLFGTKRLGFTLATNYWEQPPFTNCMALQTPVNEPDAGSFYTGWEFGEVWPQFASRPGSGFSTKAISPAAMVVGHTYRSAGHTVFHVADRELHHYLIDSNGGSGTGEIAQDQSPGDTLGYERSVTDTLSMEVAIKRVG
jgi:hypothetical protein